LNAAASDKQSLGPCAAPSLTGLKNQEGGVEQPQGSGSIFYDDQQIPSEFLEVCKHLCGCIVLL
jgi:hypothetical protein